MKRIVQKARKASDYKRAFTDAEKQVRQEQVAVLAAEIRKVMAASKAAHERMIAAEVELRVLQQDLSDLRAGKLDKIRKRQEAEEGKKYSKIDIKVVEPLLVALQNRPLPQISAHNLSYSPTFTTAGALPSTVGSVSMFNAAFDEAVNSVQ